MSPDEPSDADTFDLWSMAAADAVFGSVRGPNVVVTHPATACDGEPCPLHNPSAHPLNAAPLVWRADRGLMERICQHGVGHPDPDSIAYALRHGSCDTGVHGCDGCCAMSTPQHARSVTTIGDLRAAHFGQPIRIPDLHQPGTDWDAPKVTIEGRLIELRQARFGLSDRYVWVGLKPLGQIDTPIPLTHPCYLTQEDTDE